MLKQYYVNIQTTENPNNNHEVHSALCQWLPSPQNRMYLGTFESCSDAVKIAQMLYINVDGCAQGCPSCHKA